MTEPSPVVLVNHACKPSPIPHASPTITEAARLRAALIWEYEYTLQQYGLVYDFSSAIYLNNSAPHLDAFAGEAQFEVTEETKETEEAAGPEATLLIRTIEGRCLLDSIEVVPLDSSYRPIAFTVLDASPTERTLSYTKEWYSTPLKITCGGLNVFRQRSAQACAEPPGGTPVCFSQPVTALIERPSDTANEIRIDQLIETTTARPLLEDFLRELFEIIFLGASQCRMSFKSDYFYPLDGTGMETSVPIMLTILDLSASGDKELLAREMAGQIKQVCRENSQTRHGTLRFQLRAYDPDSAQEAAQLTLDNLTLPVDAVADLFDNSTQD